MDKFSEEEYLRALAENGDPWAIEAYENALEQQIVALQASLEQAPDDHSRQEQTALLKQVEARKREYFQGKEEKKVSELKRHQEEETRLSKETQSSIKWDFKWILPLLAVAVVAISIMTLLWYSNNQNENETNPWKNGQFAQSQATDSETSAANSNQVDTSSLSDDQLQDWILSTYAQAQGGSGEDYKNLQWKTYSWTDTDGLVYAQLYDSYGNDVLLFRVNSDGQLEAFGGLDGTSGSWDVVATSYTSA